LCSLPSSSIGFQIFFPVEGSSPIFSKLINWFANPASLHALHSQKPSITPRQPSDTAALYEGICQVIDHVLRQGAQPLSQAEWNVQFNQRPFLYDNLKITKVDKLKKLRFLMISEIAAYTKSATLADSNAAKNNENSMSSGYKAALNWINAEINRQTLQTT